MSIGRKAFEGASWLALFKFLSQLFSWLITILVARILTPDDYGLMTKATVITGYAMMFNELGLGAAIIQRPKLTQDELSSIFWFSLIFGSILGLLCFPISYPTAWIFHDNRVIPLTQAVSILFVFGALQIVPLNLLKKELDFKKIGIIEVTAVSISSILMYALAEIGAGVWTLLGGHIIRSFTRLILTYKFSGWLPRFYYKHDAVRHYVRYGATVALGESLFYVYDKSDRFFAGRAWPTTSLGYYTFALQLAKMPVEKIVVLINQVSFSAFSKLQGQPQDFQRFYLNIIALTAALVFPIFGCGFLVGDELIRVLLSPKWHPIIFLFKMLCLAQIMTAMNAVNNFVHIAQGRARWSLFFNISMAVVLPPSFYFATLQGVNAVLVPWFSTYLFLCLCWIFLTLKKCEIPVSRYFKRIYIPALGVCLMSLGIFSLRPIFVYFGIDQLPWRLVLKVIAGAFVYFVFMFIFANDLLMKVKSLIKRR